MLIIKRYVLTFFWLLLVSLVVPTLAQAADRDADQDGVQDADDRCALSPPNQAVNPKGCHFRYEGAMFTVRFKAGSSWVDAEQTLALRDVAKMLARTSREFAGLRVSVRGYSGGAADASKAENLSLLRAKQVARQLKVSGLSDDAIEIRGLGRASVGGDAQGARRVDILVLPWHPPN